MSRQRRKSRVAIKISTINGCMVHTTLSDGSPTSFSADCTSTQEIETTVTVPKSKMNKQPECN